MNMKGLKLAKRAFSKKPTRFSVMWMLPNFLTICALIFGLQAMYQALLGNWNMVIILIIIAALFDLLDGRVARLLKSTSNFGMHLDSLSDFVVFGTVPVLAVFFWMGMPTGSILWFSTVLYVICSALRLARFNSELSDRPSYAKNYFTGIPTPAASFLILLPISALPIFNLDHFKTELYISIWITLISIGMVSNLPTFSGKVIQIPRPLVIPFLILLGILSHSLISDPIMGFTILVFVYMIGLPIAPIFYFRLKKKAEALHHQEKN